METITIENNTFGNYVVSTGRGKTGKVTIISKKKWTKTQTKVVVTDDMKIQGMDHIVSFPRIFDEFAFSGDGNFFYGLRGKKIYFFNFVKKVSKIFYTTMENFGCEFNKFLHEKIIFLHNNTVYIINCVSLSLYYYSFGDDFHFGTVIKNITIPKCKSYFTCELVLNLKGASRKCTFD